MVNGAGVTVPNLSPSAAWWRRLSEPVGRLSERRTRPNPSEDRNAPNLSPSARFPNLSADRHGNATGTARQIGTRRTRDRSEPVTVGRLSEPEPNHGEPVTVAPSELSPRLPRCP